MLQAMGKYCLGKIIEKPKKESGLILPDENEGLLYVEVFDIGLDVEIDEALIPGDHVFLRKSYHTKIKWDGQEYIVFEAEAILVKVWMAENASQNCAEIVMSE